MAAKKQSRFNGNVTIVILSAVSAAVAAGAAAAIEGITKHILKRKRGAKDKPADPQE